LANINFVVKNDIDNTGTVALTSSIPPVGSVVAYALATPPAGWLLCNGTVHNISSYPTLGAGLGSTYGGNGTTTFAVPNLKGRMPVGLDSTQTEFDGLGEVGGSKNSVASHTHGINHDHASFATTDGAGNHNHPWSGVNSDAGISGSGGNYPFRIYQDIATNWNGTQGSMGGAGAHNHTIDVPNFTGTSGAASAEAASGNLQPYIVMNYIIRAV
jgi:microcystin-dependent protein